jgi:hypothetical protein
MNKINYRKVYNEEILEEILEEIQEDEKSIRAGYLKACKDIDEMSDEFLSMVWDAIGENEDPPTHRDGYPWEDWVHLIYVALCNRGLSTAIKTRESSYIW